MANSLFKIPEALDYKGDSKNWKKFKQQFDIYMKASGLEKNDSENKVNVFLNIAGEEAMEIFENLNLTTDQRKDYDQVIQAFDSHCMSKENEIYKRFKFFTRVQQASEFFSEFYDDLLVMASFCNFGNQKDRLVRDRIIVGIRNSALQEKFLTSPDLTLEEVVNICMDQELENMNTGILKAENAIESMEILNSDEESNNNYDELTNVPISELDQIHIPNEILFNDLAEEEGYEGEIDFDELNSKVDIGDIKLTNVTTYEKSKSDEKRRKMSVESDDITYEFCVEESEEDFEMPEEIVEEPCDRKTRSSQKHDKLKSIETNDVKVESKKSNVIQKKTENKQKKTRTKLKIELVEECEDSVLKYYEIPIEDQEEYSEIHQEAEATPEVKKDQKIIDIEENSEVSEVDASQDECDVDVDTEASNEVSLEMMNEMAEAEYLLEKDTSVSPQKKTRRKMTRRRKNANTTQKKEPEIIKVKRDNLPPLILKAVKKKTLLLGKMPYPCKKCDATFWTSFQLERHQLVHVLKKVPPPSKPPSKVFKCEECGKEFKKICDLERHTRVHTGEKPSVCNICNKRFQQSYNLNKHLYTHTQEKNFECVICQKKFGRNDVLNRHVLTHSIVKPFRCSICSRTFIRNSQLKLHLRKHHGLDEDPGNEMNVDDPVAGTSAKA